MDLHWTEGFSITVRNENGAVVISANPEGLCSLANHLLTLAEESCGAHLHLDENNALEDGSVELVLERV